MAAITAAPIMVEAITAAVTMAADAIWAVIAWGTPDAIIWAAMWDTVTWDTATRDIVIGAATISGGITAAIIAVWHAATLRVRRCSPGITIIITGAVVTGLRTAIITTMVTGGGHSRITAVMTATTTAAGGTTGHGVAIAM